MRSNPPPPPRRCTKAARPGLRFYYLAVKGYANGIGLDGQTGHPSVNKQGMYIRPSAGVNGNWVKGMTFQNIGDKFGPGRGIDGFGAILLTDSSNNLISKNTSTPSRTPAAQPARSTASTTRTSARATPSH